MNGEPNNFNIFNIFNNIFDLSVSAEFLRADQLWKIKHWEALRDSPFPVVIVPVEPEPISLIPGGQFSAAGSHAAYV